MKNGNTEVLDSQRWIADRWEKHSDSISIAHRFSQHSSWNQLSLSDNGLNVVAMSSLAAALANEGKEAWLDATRLAWRMAVANSDLRGLAIISGNLSQLGQDPFITPEYHSFRERNYALAQSFCAASNWTVGNFLIDADWSKVLRNSGDVRGFCEIASGLDKSSVLRFMLSAEATPTQRFRVVQTLALYELERSSAASRLDWMLGLLSELGSDVEAGSTAMRVLLVDTELAIKQKDFHRAFVGALQLVQHMTAGKSELCGRADLLCLLRSITQTFASEGVEKLSIMASVDLAPKNPSKIEQLESLARDIDRINTELHKGLCVTLPRLANRESNKSKHSSVILPFNPKR